MTQVTKAMGEIPRALPQIYYCIDGHERGEGSPKKKARGGGGGGGWGWEGREEVGCGVSKKRMKLGGRAAGAREVYKQMNVGPE